MEDRLRERLVGAAQFRRLAEAAADEIITDVDCELRDVRLREVLVLVVSDEDDGVGLVGVEASSHGRMGIQDLLETFADHGVALVVHLGLIGRHLAV